MPVVQRAHDGVQVGVCHAGHLVVRTLQHLELAAAERRQALVRGQGDPGYRGQQHADPPPAQLRDQSGDHVGGATELRLGAEFHHNGLAVRCAQIGRVPRGLAHTWDRERLSAETIELLRADGTAIREHLITAVVPFEDAPELFANLAARRRHELQAVLAFDSSMAEPHPAAALRLE